MISLDHSRALLRVIPAASSEGGEMAPCLLTPPQLEAFRRMFHAGREYNYKAVVTEVPNPHIGPKYERADAPLQFDSKINLIGFLNLLNGRLIGAGIPIKGFYLKGGAVQAILTGEIKKLSDLDLRIVVGDDCNWERLERCFLEVLDLAVGVSVVRTQDRKMVDTTYWYQGKEIGRVRAHNSYSALPFCRGQGGLGMLQKVVGEGNDYMLYSLPTEGESIDLQFVKKSDVNCLTSSDCLQIDLTPLVLNPTIPVEAVSYIAVDGYDGAEACQLNEQRQFKVDPDRIRKIRHGLRAYAKIVTKGRYPIDLTAEREFYKLFLNEMREGSFDSYLTRYLDDHFAGNNNGRILCLLNFLEIVNRCKKEGDDHIPYVEMVIRRSLCTALGVDIQEIKEKELSHFTLAALEYLHLLSEEKIPAGGMVFFRAREVKRPDEINPQNWLFASIPKGALQDVESLLKNRLFLELVKLYPHDERDLPAFLKKASTPMKVDRAVQAPTPAEIEGEPSPSPFEHEPGAGPVRLSGSYTGAVTRLNEPSSPKEVKQEPRAATPPPLGVLEAVRRNRFERSVENGHCLLDYLSTANQRDIEVDKNKFLEQISRMLLFLRDRRENLLAWQIFAAACNFDPLMKEIRFEEFFDPRLLDIAPPTEVVSLYARYATQVKRPFEPGLRLAMHMSYKDPDAILQLLSLSRLKAMDPFQPLFIRFLKERKIVKGVSILPLSWVGEYLPMVEAKKDLKALYEEMKPQMEEAEGEDNMTALRLYNQFMDRLLSGDPSIRSGLVKMISILSHSPVDKNLDCKTAVMELAAKPDLLIGHLQIDELRAFLSILRSSGLKDRYSECEKVLSRRVGDAAPAAPQKPKKKGKAPPQVEKPKSAPAKPILAHFKAKQFEANEILSFIELCQDKDRVMDQEVLTGFDALLERMKEPTQLSTQDFLKWTSALERLESARRLPASFYDFFCLLLNCSERGELGGDGQVGEKMSAILSSGLKKRVLGLGDSRMLRHHLMQILKRANGIQRVRSVLDVIDTRLDGANYLKFVCELFSSTELRGISIHRPHLREILGCMFEYFNKLFKAVEGKNQFSSEYKTFLLYRPFFQLSEFSLILLRAGKFKSDDPIMEQIFSTMERIIALAKKLPDETAFDKLKEVGKSLKQIGVMRMAEQSRQKVFALLGLAPGLTEDEMKRESVETLFDAAEVVDPPLALELLVHARERFVSIDQLARRDKIALERNIGEDLVRHYENAGRWLEVARLQIFLNHPDKVFEALSRIPVDGKEPAILSIYRARAFAQAGDGEKEIEHMAEYVRRLIFLKQGIIGVQDVDVRHAQLKGMDPVSRSQYFQLRLGVEGGDPKNIYLLGLSTRDIAIDYEDPERKRIALMTARGHLYQAVKALETDLPILTRPVAFPPPMPLE